ncbi:MAG: hypothetical protein ACYC61_32630 [Isosphaeraceae bacterium]
MAAAVGQAPAEAGWLDSVPADIPVVARVRALEDVSGELQAMLKAMSPTAAEAAARAIEPTIQGVEGAYGEAVGKNPFFVMLRLPNPAQPDLSAWGVIIRASDPAATIKGLQDGGEKPKSLQGYESFASKDGGTWYAARGKGWLAFGPDEAMIKAIAKPGAGLGKAMSAEVRERFLAGDVGLYLDIPALNQQYGPLVEQAGPGLIAQVEQQPNGAQNAKNAKMMLDGLVAALKVGDRLVLSLDFDARGLTISGLATVKADTPAAKNLASARTGTGKLLERLPDDKMIYIFTADRPVLPKGVQAKQSTPELEKAIDARMKALEGRLVMAMSWMPLQFISLADPSDPTAVVKATLEASKVRSDSGQEKSTIQPDALTYGGFRFNRVKSEIDADQLAKATKTSTPNSDQILKMIFTGKSLTTLMGTDGKLFLEVSGNDENELKKQVDAVKAAGHGLGTQTAWKALRSRFPENVSVLVLLSAQETAKALLQGIGAGANRPDLKPPADLPKAPALLGFGLISSPNGYDFRLIIPSDVGPVFEKGLAPLGGVE